MNWQVSRNGSASTCGLNDSRSSREIRGQRCRLEIIDVEMGAQTVEAAVPFVGASFDLRDHHVHLMFGSRVGDRSHLTHSIERDRRYLHSSDGITPTTEAPPQRFGCRG
jgi:hypothetical protein